MKKVIERLAKYSKERVDEESESEANLSETEKQERQERIAKKKAEMRKKFESFWNEYSRNIKYGLIQDTQNKNALAEVVKFKSTFNES